MLSAYPGYTVRSLEAELSWREVEELMDSWGERPPAFVTLYQLEKMYERAHGYRVKEKGKRLSGREAIEALKRQGWL